MSMIVILTSHIQDPLEYANKTHCYTQDPAEYERLTSHIETD